jgi:hypothetical protein
MPGGNVSYQIEFNTFGAAYTLSISGIGGISIDQLGFLILEEGLASGNNNFSITLVTANHNVQAGCDVFVEEPEEEPE